MTSKSTLPSVAPTFPFQREIADSALAETAASPAGNAADAQIQAEGGRAESSAPSPERVAREAKRLEAIVRQASRLEFDADQAKSARSGGDRVFSVRAVRALAEAQKDLGVCPQAIAAAAASPLALCWAVKDGRPARAPLLAAMLGEGTHVREDPHAQGWLRELAGLAGFEPGRPMRLPARPVADALDDAREAWPQSEWAPPMRMAMASASLEVGARWLAAFPALKRQGLWADIAFASKTKWAPAEAQARWKEIAQAQESALLEIEPPARLAKGEARQEAGEGPSQEQAKRREEGAGAAEPGVKKEAKKAEGALAEKAEREKRHGVFLARHGAALLTRWGMRGDRVRKLSAPRLGKTGSFAVFDELRTLRAQSAATSAQAWAWVSETLCLRSAGDAPETVAAFMASQEPPTEREARIWAEIWDWLEKAPGFDPCVACGPGQEDILMARAVLARAPISALTLPIRWVKGLPPERVDPSWATLAAMTCNNYVRPEEDSALKEFAAAVARASEAAALARELRGDSAGQDRAATLARRL